MNAVQKHRGPDGQGVYESLDEQVALGHVRLSILDLSDAAGQPMRSPCDRYILSYNGEIYNFPALKQQLESEGIRFRSSGDTEVLMQGLVRHGEGFIPTLNGMFAFAFWDRSEKRLLVARDRMGIKPLYYSQLSDGSLILASEMKAFLKHPPTFPAIPISPRFPSIWRFAMQVVIEPRSRVSGD